MLAGLQALHRLRGVHLGRGAQDHRVHFRQRQRFGQIGGHVRDAILVGDFLGGLIAAANQRHHFHAVDQLDGVQMLDAEGAGASQRYLDGLAHCLFSRIR
ncbi:hypothetical protein D3C84_964260 [compost metagenome]